MSIGNKSVMKARVPGAAHCPVITGRGKDRTDVPARHPPACLSVSVPPRVFFPHAHVCLPPDMGSRKGLKP